MEKFYYTYYNNKQQEILIDSWSKIYSNYLDPTDSIRKDQTKLKNCITCFIQNCLRSLNKNNNKFTISLSKNIFSKPVVFNGIELKGKMLSYRYFRPMIDWLVLEGKIELEKGFYIKGNFIDCLDRADSIITLLPSLIDELSPYLSSEVTKSKELMSVIVLKNAQGQNTPFKVTQKIQRFITQMINYNDSLKDRVTLDDQPFSIFFSRIFKNNLKSYGRFYDVDAGFQRMSGEVRRSLKIDGCNVVELDYSSLHASLLFSKLGIDTMLEFGENFDPYKINLSCYTPKQNRALAKKAFMLLINTRSSVSCLMALNKAIYEDRVKVVEKEEPSDFHLTKELYNGVINTAGIISAVQDTNAALFPYFYKENSSWLQNIDSELANYIMSHFQQRNEVCLSVFDSFIVREELEQELYNVMMSAYKEIVGIPNNCKISKK